MAQGLRQRSLIRKRSEINFHHDTELRRGMADRLSRFARLISDPGGFSMLGVLEYVELRTSRIW